MSVERRFFVAVFGALARFAVLGALYLVYWSFGVLAAAIVYSLCWGFANADKIEARIKKEWGDL